LSEDEFRRFVFNVDNRREIIETLLKRDMDDADLRREKIEPKEQKLDADTASILDERLVRDLRYLSKLGLIGGKEGKCSVTRRGRELYEKFSERE